MVFALIELGYEHVFDYFALGKALLKLYELTQAKNKRDVSNELRRFFNGEKPGDGHSVRLGDGHGDSEKSTGEMASLVGGINALLSTSDAAPRFVEKGCIERHFSGSGRCEVCGATVECDRKLNALTQLNGHGSVSDKLATENAAMKECPNCSKPKLIN